MGKYKLIALDMDGTLLNSKKEISEAAAAMIKKAAAEGKEVVLSTGRGVAELQEYMEKIPEVRYINGTSGAMVYDWKEKKVIDREPLSVEDIRKLMVLAKEEDTMVHFLTAEGSLVQKDYVDKMTEYQMGIYQEMFAVITKQVDDIYDYYDKQPFTTEKFNLYHRSAESRAKTEEHIKKAGISVEMAYAETASLEISASGVNKARGLKSLCKHLGLSIDEVIAVGDADNDIEVLKAAGLSIAMGNADEKIKALADVVVADCDHDGCAEAIEKYLLG